MPRNIAELIKHLKTFPTRSMALDDLLSDLKTHPTMDRDYEGHVSLVADLVAWLINAIPERKLSRLADARERNALQVQQSKDRMDSRVLALTLVQQTLLPHLNHVKFLRVDPVKVAIQLVFRILRPELIDQGGMDVCLPAAMVAQMARTKPVEYAHFVSCLLRFGHANLGNLAVNPGAEICNGYNPMMSECDYVVLASIRSNLVGRTTEHVVDICGYLELMGYVRIQDSSFCKNGRTYQYGPRPDGFIYPVGSFGKRKVFNQMLGKMNSRSHVIMRTSRALAQSFYKDEPLAHSGEEDLSEADHALYVTKVTYNLATDKLDMKYFSWGRLLATWKRPYYLEGLKVDIFLSYFGGFLSYQDNPNWRSTKLPHRPWSAASSLTPANRAGFLQNCQQGRPVPQQGVPVPPAMKRE